MAFEQWREKLAESEIEYAPLIFNCLLAVQILAVIRDYILIDYQPTYLIIVNGVAIILLTALSLLAFKRRLPEAWNNLFVMIGVLAFAFKTLTIVYVESQPNPLVLAVLMFALGLCFLSQFYLMLTGAVVALAWVGVASLTLPLVQLISTLLAMVLGWILGMLVLERRLQGLARVYELEKRIATLETILPMCASCKKTRDTNGVWKNIEEYVEDQRGVQVSHGVCPECSKALYGEYYSKRNKPA